MATRPRTTKTAKTTKTTARRTTTRKSAAAAKPAAAKPKPEEVPVVVSPEVPDPAAGATVVTEKPVVAGPVLKKMDLIDRVVEATGMKKKDVKPVVEAALTQLGSAIGRGEDLNLPGLGKLKINREKDLANARVFVCKLRQPKDAPPDGAPDPLAAAAE